MTHWKEQFDNEFGDFGHINEQFKGVPMPEDIKSYISTEIIEKLIDDIPDTITVEEIGLTAIDKKNKELKQQLRDKWLNINN